jgi:hypothetical protein
MLSNSCISLILTFSLISFPALADELTILTGTVIRGEADVFGT